MGPRPKLTYTNDISETAGQARSVLNIFRFAA